MTDREFIDSYLPLSEGLYRIAFYILESASDAEDAVQDLYVKLWQSRDALDMVRNPKSYCTTLIRNSCIDRLRHNSRIQSGDVPDTVCSSSDTLASVTARQSLSMTMEAIQALPRKHREVLWMKVIEDLSYDEISERTGMNYLTLRVIVSQARRKLKTTAI